MNRMIDLYREDQLPLLYRAACDGVWGERQIWTQGAITDALFVYLEGEPEPQSVDALNRHFTRRPLVCLSAAWEDYILTQHPDAARYTRFAMGHLRHFDFRAASILPEGFRTTPFDEAIFARHPFSHGENYPSYEAFRENGSGAVVLHGDEIVASASSFLSHRGEVELDVSTDENFRRQGFAAACVRQMLLDCQNRGIAVHWDAQNEESRRLAEKFGFRVQYDYPVYILPKIDENEA